MSPKSVWRSIFEHIGVREQAKTMRNVAVEMAMDLCIDEKDEREGEAQSAVRAKKRARGEARALLRLHG